MAAAEQEQGLEAYLSQIGIEGQDLEVFTQILASVQEHMDEAPVFFHDWEVYLIEGLFREDELLRTDAQDAITIDAGLEAWYATGSDRYHGITIHLFVSNEYSGNDNVLETAGVRMIPQVVLDHILDDELPVTSVDGRDPEEVIECMFEHREKNDGTLVHDAYKRFKTEAGLIIGIYVDTRGRESYSYSAIKDLPEDSVQVFKIDQNL